MKFSKFRFDFYNEDGLSSVVTFMIMALLSVLAMTVYFLSTTDTRLATRRLQTTQAMYLAESGIEYGLKCLNSDSSMDEEQEIPNNGGVIQLDTSTYQEYTLLTSQGEIAGTNRAIRVYLQNKVNLGGVSIYSTGTVDNVTSLDENRDPAPELMVESADSLPTIDYLGLTDMAINQSHVEYSSPFKPDDGYPNGSFYYSPGVQNVTHVTGDFKVEGGKSVYGIFVVEGDVYLHGSSRLEGVVYLPNRDSEVLQITITGGGTPSESSVVGGIVANGDVTGSGNHITVQYDQDYMQYFGEFEKPSKTYWIVQWEEL